MRLIRPLILLVSTFVMIGVMLALLEFLGEPVALTDKSVLAAPLETTLDTSNTTTPTISGPDAAAVNEVVTYTIVFSVPSGTTDDWWGLEYLVPNSFTVISTDPITSSMMGNNVLRWTAAQLAGHNLVTITGQHDSADCPARHIVRIFDIYVPNPPEFSTATVVGSCIFLPIVLNNYPWISPLGVESSSPLMPGSTLLSRAVDLQVGWVRLGAGRISWRALQPEEGGDIQWDLLASFEDELRALKAAGLTPEVVILDSPRWATINDIRNDGLPTSCGPIRTDRFDDFAQFMRALVTRYKTPEFNVHHWELGNEPDVDPDLVAPDNGFGCWGDIDDPYYGGRHYGEMLKVVGPAIKSEDPTAQVWIGGLLLDRPDTTEPWKGKPELFLQGILEAGAAPYFDVVPYHAYPAYVNQKLDHDKIAGAWTSWGGNIVGKANYLRQLMNQYGIDKPVFLNETGLMCPDYYWWCHFPPMSPEPFYQMQANHIVRAFVRGLSEDVMGLIWFTLNGPGWRHTGLLDGDSVPKPVYYAYQRLNLELRGSRFAGTADYRDGIEAYAFRQGPKYVHVLWAEEDQTLAVPVPQSEFVEARDRDGHPITATLIGSEYYLPVGFEPLYIVRAP